MVKSPSGSNEVVVLDTVAPKQCQEECSLAFVQDFEVWAHRTHSLEGVSSLTASRWKAT